MDPAHLKLQFNRIKYLQKTTQEKFSAFEDSEKEWKALPYMTKNLLEQIEQTRRDFEQQLKECKRCLVESYQFAITENVDVDDSRILKVYQFLYSKGAQITHLLQCINLPRGSNSIWGIVILIAIIYLWATV